MPKLTCPHCNHRAMSVWRKLSANFAWSGNCPNCGGAIGIPSWSFHAWLVIVAIAIPIYFLLPERWGVTVIIALVVLHNAIQLYVVPIERRDA